MRMKPLEASVLTLYMLTWFLALQGNGYAVALAGSVSYAAGQAWGMRRGKIHLSADGVALPVAALAVLVASVLGGAAPGMVDLPGLVTALVALGMAYVAGHAVVALTAVLLHRRPPPERRSD